MRLRHRGGCVLLLALLASACASGAQSGPADPNRLTGDQIRAAATVANEPLYAILVRIRPQWVVGRTDVAAFVDNVPTGPATSLQVIGSSTVASVRFVDETDLAARVPGIRGAVIEVTLTP